MVCCAAQVLVLRLQTLGTVEERIVRIASEKRHMADRSITGGAASAPHFPLACFCVPLDAAVHVYLTGCPRHPPAGHAPRRRLL